MAQGSSTRRTTTRKAAPQKAARPARAGGRAAPAKQPVVEYEVALAETVVAMSDSETVVDASSPFYPEYGQLLALPDTCGELSDRERAARIELDLAERLLQQAQKECEVLEARFAAAQEAAANCMKDRQRLLKSLAERLIRLDCASEVVQGGRLTIRATPPVEDLPAGLVYVWDAGKFSVTGCRDDDNRDCIEVDTKILSTGAHHVRATFGWVDPRTQPDPAATRKEPR